MHVSCCRGTGHAGSIPSGPGSRGLRPGLAVTWCPGGRYHQSELRLVGILSSSPGSNYTRPCRKFYKLRVKISPTQYPQGLSHHCWVPSLTFSLGDSCHPSLHLCIPYFGLPQSSPSPFLVFFKTEENKQKFNDMYTSCIHGRYPGKLSNFLFLGFCFFLK